MDNLLEKIDDIKQLIPDQNYRDIMSALTSVYNSGNYSGNLYSDGFERIVTGEIIPGITCMSGGYRIIYNNDLYGSIEILFDKSPTIERNVDDLDRWGIGCIDILVKPNDVCNGEFTNLEKLPKIKVNDYWIVVNSGEVTIDSQ